ncbi:MAG: DUF2062 domain-containing protein [Phycisphaera sp.]|nr:DUF2062 domain-containing protein [Phycisphaera sp.]
MDKAPPDPQPDDGIRPAQDASRKKSWWSRAWHSVVSLHGEPWQIALGFALGVFISFTPTIGLQLVLAALLATLFNLSRPAAVLPIFITNPLTIPPIFAFTYYVGCFFWPTPTRPMSHARQVLEEVMHNVARHNFYELQGQFEEVLKLGKEMIMPMVIGGVLIGVLTAIPSYFIVKWGVLRYRELKRRYRERHRAHLRKQREEEV